jgi:S-adenosylmethionine:tRNA-ribosyltransferase-isomerase (queuine synthetase)
LAEVWYKTKHRLKAGTALLLPGGLSCEVVSVAGKSARLRLPAGSDWQAIMAESGQMPIPLYFKRVSDAKDHQDDQTVFAGRDDLLRAYRHAIVARYRFYSDGGGMLI